MTNANPIILLYTEILWRPLLNCLVWLYVNLPFQDLGLAIVVLTVIIRVLLSPLLFKMRKAQQDLAKIQPEIKRLQEQYKNDRNAQSRALMELYAAHKVNPFSGCITAFIQFPLLIAIFQVFQSGLDPSSLSYLYSFVPNPGILDPVGFGAIDLSKGNIPLGVAAAAVQYMQGKLVALPSISNDKFDFAKIMQWQMPLIILIASISFPSSLAVYWTVSNFFDIVQEFIKRGSKESIKAIWKMK